MRKVAAALILLLTLLGAVEASAATLRVDGGTLQVFTYPAKPDLQKMKPPDAPLPLPTPVWDGSRLALDNPGFSCADGYLIYADAVNLGAAMRGPAAWTLLRGDRLVEQGQLASLAEQGRTRLEVLADESGVYRFELAQRPGYPGENARVRTEIVVDARGCLPEPTEAKPTLQPERPLPTTAVTPVCPTEPPSLPTTAPTREPAPTEEPAPAATPTAAPVIETPTAEPPPPTLAAPSPVPTQAPTEEQPVELPPTVEPPPTLAP